MRSAPRQSLFAVGATLGLALGAQVASAQDPAGAPAPSTPPAPSVSADAQQAPPPAAAAPLPDYDPLAGPLSDPLAGPAAAPFQGAQTPPGPLPLPPQAVAELTSWPSGRLARATCGAAPFRLGGCRHPDPAFTGTLITYYERGGVAEVLPVRDGQLDGLVEVYDSTGHLVEQRLFRAGQPLAPGEAGQGPIGPADPPLPAPPPPVVVGAPGAAEGTPEAAPDAAPGSPPPSPRLDPPRLYLGVSGQIGFVSSDVVNAFVGGGRLHLVPRMGSAFVELSIGVMRAYNGGRDYSRLDMPVGFGLQVPLRTGEKHTVYALAGLQVTYARRTIPGDVPGAQQEEAVLLGGELGFGLRRRVAPHASLFGELRFTGSGRGDRGEPLRLLDSNGVPADAIGKQYQLLLGFGVLWHVVP